MRTVSISQLSRAVEYTTDKDAFVFRLKFHKIDEDIINILWKMYKLIHLTDYAPERVREALKKDKRYSDVARDYGVSVGTIKREVHDLSKRLQASWGGDLWEMVRNKEEISPDYLRKLNVILDDSLDRSNILIENIEDKFTVDLSKYRIKRGDYKNITDEDFLSMRQKMTTFSKNAQKFILDNMDETLVGYGLYLLSEKDTNLSDKERQRKEELQRFTMIQD